jgi:hypothetical protein
LIRSFLDSRAFFPLKRRPLSSFTTRFEALLSWAFASLGLSPFRPWHLLRVASSFALSCFCEAQKQRCSRVSLPEDRLDLGEVVQPL